MDHGDRGNADRGASQPQVIQENAGGLAGSRRQWDISGVVGITNRCLATASSY